MKKQLLGRLALFGRRRMFTPSPERRAAVADAQWWLETTAAKLPPDDPRDLVQRLRESGL